MNDYSEAEERLAHRLRDLRRNRPLDIADVVGAIRDCDLKLVTRHSILSEIPGYKGKKVPIDPKDW